MNTSKKIFQENSYLTSLAAEVIGCVKKGEFYEVILDKTIFYPHMSGGQPKDEGTINGHKVYDVVEEGEKIIHKLKEPVEGSVKLIIDFAIRIDYMQQHTGQHILSYAFSSLYKGNTIGFHLSKDYTTIDLDIAVNDDIIGQVENLSNRIIYENRPVTASTLDYNDAIKMKMRKTPPKLHTLRIISIEGYDENACGGTHVKNTGEIGIIKVIKTEKYKSGTRLEFLCGKRALKDYINKNKMISELSTLLSCKSDMLVDNTEKLINENKKYKKEIVSLNNSLNDYKSDEFKNNALTKDDVKYIFNKSDSDVKDLRFICSKITEDDNYVVFLVSENDTCSIVIGQSKNLNLDLKRIFEECKYVINAKGGGNNFLMQCSGSLLKGDKCMELAKKEFNI